jgi:hypothetical protein
MGWIRKIRPAGRQLQLQYGDVSMTSLRSQEGSGTRTKFSACADGQTDSSSFDPSDRTKCRKVSSSGGRWCHDDDTVHIDDEECDTIWMRIHSGTAAMAIDTSFYELLFLKAVTQYGLEGITNNTCSTPIATGRIPRLRYDRKACKAASGCREERASKHHRNIAMRTHNIHWFRHPCLHRFFLV